MHKSSTTMKPTVNMPFVPWKIGSFFFSTSCSATSLKVRYSTPFSCAKS